MSWRERDDVWYGTALVRPDQENAEHGGAYVAFFVVGRDIAIATETLRGAVAAHHWSLTSLLKMTRANDIEGAESDDQFDHLAVSAGAAGVALGAFHAFPKDEQPPQ